MKRIIAFCMVLLLLAAVGFAVLRLRGHKNVTVVTPKRGPAVQAVYATGTVEPRVMLPIAPRLAARLLSIEAFEGDRLEKGQVLARFESEEAEKNLAEARARESFAEEEFKRQERLLAQRVSTREEFDRARSELDVARAAREAADTRLEYLVLLAPSAGSVIKRDGEVGQFIAANETIFWFAADGPLRVTAEVDEEDVVFLEKGMETIIQSDAFPNRHFSGQVTQITPKGDAVARSYRVRIAFDEDVPLRIGMTVENNIIVRREENALLVPVTSVLQDAIWLVVDKRLQKRRVEIGARGLEQTEIISGIDESAQVVLEPASDFEEGVQVRVKLVDWSVQ